MCQGAGSPGPRKSTSCSLRNWWLPRFSLSPDPSSCFPEFVRTLKQFNRAWQVNSSIKTLTLNSCSIADEGCKALAEVLKRNTTITELELNNNMVDYEGCAALAEALANNNALKVSLSLTLSDSLLVGRIPVRSFGSSPPSLAGHHVILFFFTPLVRPQVWKNRMSSYRKQVQIAEDMSSRR